MVEHIGRLAPQRSVVLRDRGFHAYWTCGARLPEALRLTWAGFTP